MYNGRFHNRTKCAMRVDKNCINSSKINYYISVNWAIERACVNEMQINFVCWWWDIGVGSKAICYLFRVNVLHLQCFLFFFVWCMVSLDAHKQKNPFALLTRMTIVAIGGKNYLIFKNQRRLTAAAVIP